MAKITKRVEEKMKKIKKNKKGNIKFTPPLSKNEQRKQKKVGQNMRRAAREARAKGDEYSDNYVEEVWAQREMIREQENNTTL